MKELTLGIEMASSKTKMTTERDTTVALRPSVLKTSQTTTKWTRLHGMVIKSDYMHNMSYRHRANANNYLFESEKSKTTVRKMDEGEKIWFSLVLKKHGWLAKKNSMFLFF